MKLFEELRRRNVFRVAVGYVIAGWLALQVTDVVMGLLELPSWVGRFAFFAVLLGFPLALAFSWVFQLTPEGLKRDSEVGPTEVATVATGRKLDLAIIVLLVISLGYFVVDKFVFTAPVETATTAIQARFEKSVAVLPFVASGDEEGGLFARGIHDDLLTQLSKIANLHVISRTSVMEYANTTKNLTQIGVELGVNHILEGGVQKIGDQVRINAQLIDARSDKHLWAETFDRKLTIENIFKVQSEIVEKIAGSLHASLLPETGVSIALAPTDDLEAFRDYTTARHGNIEREVRIDLLKSAVEKDPQFALAWLWLAYHLQQLYWWEGDQLYLDRALEALKRAESISPDLSELHMVRAVIQYHGFLRYEDALEELELAEKAMPGYSDNFYWRGTIYRQLGRLPEAIQAFQRAFELDPRNDKAVRDLGRTLILGHHYDDARKVFEEAITTFPQNAWWMRWFVAMVEWYQFGDSRLLLHAVDRPDWPADFPTNVLMARNAWLADDLETALRHARQIAPDDARPIPLTNPPFGEDLAREDIEIMRAGILLATGDDDGGRAILETLRMDLAQVLSEQDDPHWSIYQKLSFVLALLGSLEAAAEMAEEIASRYDEEPLRLSSEIMRAYHGMLMCHIGDLSATEEDYRWVLTRENGFTLSSLVNGWPPCRDKFKGTEHHRRLEEEFGHLSQGKTLD